MADSDLTLPQVVADELGVGVGDTRLPRLIRAASAAIRGYLNVEQLHYQAAFVETVTPRTGWPRLLLSLLPVASVASVVLPDGTTLPVTDYVLEDPKLGFLYRVTGWPFTGLVAPGLLQVDPMPGTPRPGVVVTYTGGWVTPAQAATTGWAGPARSLPEDLEEACVQTVVALHRRGGMDPNVASESLGDASITYRNPNTAIGLGGGGLIPDQAMRALENYVRPLG